MTSYANSVATRVMPIRPARKITSAIRSILKLNLVRSEYRIDRYDVSALARNVTAAVAAYSSTCDDPCFASASLTNPISVAHTPIMVPETGRMWEARLSLLVRIVRRLDMPCSLIAGQSEMACPLTGRTNDPGYRRKQIQLQYAGIGESYGCA